MPNDFNRAGARIETLVQAIGIAFDGVFPRRVDQQPLDRQGVAREILQVLKEAWPVSIHVKAAARGANVASNSAGGGGWCHQAFQSSSFAGGQTVASRPMSISMQAMRKSARGQSTSRMGLVARFVVRS